MSEAAAYLGVSTATLRNWDRTGKLKPRRHPQNGYRIYLLDDLETLLKSVRSSGETDGLDPPQVDWRAMGESEHFVQFYENDEFLAESINGFIGAALASEGTAIVIATDEHRRTLRAKLDACGIDLADVESSGRLVVLDAAETLSQFMVDGFPDPRQFADTMGALMAQVTRGQRRTHVFGEMVAMLCSEGNREAAIQLEHLWNELGKKHEFALFCAYPLTDFDEEGDELSFSGICACHSRVIPAESYASITTADKRLRAITRLQQRAQSLAAEIEQRKRAEIALREADRRKHELLTNLAHELRNPLAPIKHALELLRIEGRCSGETLAVADRHVDQLLRLIDDLLEPVDSTRAPS